MENVIGFGEVAIAIFMSFAVALTVQWIGLVALMRLMPARKAGLETAKVAGQGCRGKLGSCHSCRGSGKTRHEGFCSQKVNRRREKRADLVRY